MIDEYLDTEFCVCGKIAVGAWSWVSESFYLLPGYVPLEPDGLPPEPCCRACAYKRHGITQPDEEATPN